jgi:hypothetical protein
MTHTHTHIHTHTHAHAHTHTQYDSSGRGISPSHRPLPGDTQHSEETDILASGGFEPAISASELSQTYALDGATTRIGWKFLY